MKKLLLLLLCLSLPVSAEETYFVVGYEHISSPFVGRPLNSKKEITMDMPYIGIRHKRGSWTISADVAHLLREERYYGSNPRVSIRVEKRLWKKK